MNERKTNPELLEEIYRLQNLIVELSRTKTELAQSKEQLHTFEHRFRSLLEQTTDAVFCYEYNPPIPTNLPLKEQIARLYDGRLIECNAVCARSYGTDYSVTDVVGKKLTELFGTTKGSLDGLFKALIEGGYKIIDGEGIEKLADGSERYFLNNGHGVIENSKILRIWGTFRDVTEQKKVIIALKNSEERYHMLIHSIPYVTWISDTQGNTTFISENVKQYYGYTQEEIIENGRKYWFDRIHPEDEKIVKDAWNKLFKDRELYNIEYRIRRKDDKWIWIHDRAVNTYETKGLIYAYGTFSDITERKQMEEKLLQSEKMRAIGQLAGGIAHDFNNQLSAILNYTELIRNSIKDNPDLKFFVQNIITSVKHSANLTSQLLAFSRRGQYQSIQIDLHKIVKEIIDILRYSIDKKISIKTDLSAVDAVLSGDPSQLQNAILNIALNAKDALPDGGLICFTTKNTKATDENLQLIHATSRKKEYVQLTIEDNGIGMDEETKRNIFEPFFTTKGQGEGTGMGMAAVYGTIKSLHGAIRILSEPGKGTKVHIFLPIIKVSCKTESEQSNSDKKIDSSANIMFVDDEEMIRESSKILLTNLGYNVVTFNNGIDAVEYYSKNWKNIDLVILDILMPKMGGHEAFTKMYSINSSIKALLLSGYTDGENSQIAIKNGIKGFIHKPFRLSDISIKIKEILD